MVKYRRAGYAPVSCRMNLLRAFHKKQKMNLIVRFFAPRVTIRIDLDHFLFQKGEHSLHLSTFAFVKIEAEKVKVISLGDDRIPSELGAFKTHLFQKDNYLQKDQRFLLLVEFIRFGTYRCLKNVRKFPLPLILKPVVTLEGLEKLDDMFMGYQQTIMALATMPSAAEILIPE